MIDSINIELHDEIATNITLGEHVQELRASDADRTVSRQLIDEIEKLCRAEKGKWRDLSKKSRQTYGTGLFPRDNKRYMPGTGVHEWITYLAELPTHATALGAVIYMITRPVLQWLKNKDNRKASVQIGEVKIELRGDGSGIEDVIQAIRRSPELSVAFNDALLADNTLFKEIAKGNTKHTETPPSDNSTTNTAATATNEATTKPKKPKPKSRVTRPGPRHEN